MNPGEDDVGGHFVDDMRVVVDARGAGVCGPAVGVGGSAFGDIGLDESVQTRRRIILDDRQADTPRSVADDLDGTSERQPAVAAAPLATGGRIVLGPIQCMAGRTGEFTRGSIPRFSAVRAKLKDNRNLCLVRKNGSLMALNVVPVNNGR